MCSIGNYWTVCNYFHIIFDNTYLYSALYIIHYWKDKHEASWCFSRVWIRSNYRPKVSDRASLHCDCSHSMCAVWWGVYWAILVCCAVQHPWYHCTDMGALYRAICTPHRPFRRHARTHTHTNTYTHRHSTCSYTVQSSSSAISYTIFVL